MDQVHAPTRGETSDEDRACEIVAQMKSVDALDRVFRAVVARQSELLSDDEMLDVWLRRIQEDLSQKHEERKQNVRVRGYRVGDVVNGFHVTAVNNQGRPTELEGTSGNGTPVCVGLGSADAFREYAVRVRS
jgi:hypothetical protein